MALPPARAPITGRAYSDAVQLLNTLQTPYGVRRGITSLEDTRAALRRVHIADSAIDRLNVVHVAGTKGKGTTCNMVASILSRHRLSHAGRALKVGLLTSPHLTAVRERVCIDSVPISEPLFAQTFFELWDLLAAAAAQDGIPFPPSSKVPGAQPAQPPPPLGLFPRYGRFLTLLGLYVFIRERVDVAVLETGIGGERDSTNVVGHPAAVGITSLGLDHTDTLGNTLAEIAWHKGGIIKPGCRAYTVPQPDEAMPVLRSRASEKGTDLAVVDVDPRLAGIRLRPDAPFQRLNASLAIRLAEAVIDRLEPASTAAQHQPDRYASSLPAPFVDGLEKIRLRGRCEVLDEGALVWYFDCAHTYDSLTVATEWFVSETATRSGPRILIFNQQIREYSLDLLDAIYRASFVHDHQTILHAIFCAPLTLSDLTYKADFVNHRVDADAVAKLTVQHRFAAHWRTLSPAATTEVVHSVEDALGRARTLADSLPDGQRPHVFVTGGVQVVGAALSLLEQT